MKRIFCIFAALLLTACGVETASTAASVATLKKQELEQGKQTMEQVQQQLERANQQTALRAAEAEK